MLTGITLTLSLLGSLTQAAPDPERERALSLALGKQILAPAYSRFAESSQTLAQDLDRYCQASGGDYPTLQAQYRATLHDWMYLQAINWGPAAAGNRHPALYFWPDKKDIASRQLRTLIADADPASLDAGYFDNASIGVSGLSALERLLFDDSPVAPLSYSCHLASAIAGNSARMARQIADEWPTFVEQWRRAPDPRGGVRLLLKSMDEIAQIVSQQKIAMPLGSDPEHARARRAESWRSEQSLANIRANLDFIEAMLEGSGNQPGLLDLIAEQDSGVAEVLRAQLFATNQLFEHLDQPLESAVENRSARGKLMMLQANVDSLQELLAGDVSGALGISLGFNSRDGD
ncbi:imelysin family protein [Marinobacterium aestuariivivens]|uniref:Imelysin family protein n=1 Tax=Marinobacterium aestuariivivens TaxID=1698799 RepID=A0ABW2A479_9GAMM